MKAEIIEELIYEYSGQDHTDIVSASKAIAAASQAELDEKDRQIGELVEMLERHNECLISTARHDKCGQLFYDSQLLIAKHKEQK